MGRWTQYDEDEYRLPEGMQRTGYDADTGKYYFRDQDGAVYSSTTEYGPMTKESEGSSHAQMVHMHVEDDTQESMTVRRGDGYQSVPSNMDNTYANGNKEAYRTLLPFFLIIAVVLLGVWRYILYPSWNKTEVQCPEDQSLVVVQPGGSCWEIATAHGLSVEELKQLNPQLNCDPLLPGSSICVPSQSSS